MCASKPGASSGGRLKEAKMVRQSRTVKRAKVGRGTGRDEPAEPKICVNLLSLYRQSARLVVDVPRNLGVPAVVDEGGVECRVEEAVSMVLAVK
jgi:hypothetical protein